MKTKVFLSAVFYLFSSPLLLANNEIVITADRIKSSPYLTTSQVKVFDSKEISKHSSLSSLLEEQSDLSFITSGPSGGTTSLFLRGNDSSHLLVIIDGIIMNDPSNPNRQFDLGRLSLTSIKKIELLKGSQGILYGSNAVGGVLLITTKDEAPHSVKISLDTFSKNQYELFTAKKFDKTLINLSVDHLKTSGFSAAHDLNARNSDDDGQKRTTLQSKIKHQVTDELVTEFNYRYVHDFTEIDKGGGNNSDDPNDYQTNQEQYAKINLSLLKAHSESQAGVQFTKHNRSNVSLNDITYQLSSKTKTEGILLQYFIYHSYQLTEKLEQNVALDLQQESDLLKNKNTNTSLSLYHLYDLTNGALNFGLRMDYNKFFKEYFTYKLAFNHKWNDVIWRGSYSTGFRAPSLNQLFDPRYGNRNLQPEKSQNIELGPEYEFVNRVKARLSLFATEVHNRLSYNPVTFVNLNIGRQRNYGSEVDVSYDFQSLGKLQAATTLLKTQDLSTRQKLARRPSVNSRLTHIFNFNDRWSLMNQFKYVGKREDVDNNGFKVKMPGYGLINSQIGLAYSEAFKLNLKANNLLNKKYEDVFGYNSPKRNVEFSVQYFF
jgi:vitamin B12 transporter